MVTFLVTTIWLGIKGKYYFKCRVEYWTTALTNARQLQSELEFNGSQKKGDCSNYLSNWIEHNVSQVKITANDTAVKVCLRLGLQ